MLVDLFCLHCSALSVGVVVSLWERALSQSLDLAWLDSSAYNLRVSSGSTLLGAVGSAVLSVLLRVDVGRCSWWWCAEKKEGNV